SGRQIAFVGLLPPEGSSADKYLQGISGSDFVSAWNSRTVRLLDISVPEFKYDYDASMADPLRKMGMVSAFSTSADFSGMIYPDLSTPGIHIDDVIHKTHIELDKNGTKAAAATAVIMKAGSVMREEEAIEVHLDRPFVYALVDTKTGIPLFAGILREATK
ncbi:MAG: proteinase inhibitor I4 serpin, partial [Mogibacterium sp.]|nr:proteinase inhibitor I4 serpin [Mogibacterium sp.]